MQPDFKIKLVSYTKQDMPNADKGILALQRLAQLLFPDAQPLSYEPVANYFKVVRNVPSGPITIEQLDKLIGAFLGNVTVELYILSRIPYQWYGQRQPQPKDPRFIVNQRRLNDAGSTLSRIRLATYNDDPSLGFFIMETDMTNRDQILADLRDGKFTEELVELPTEQRFEDRWREAKILVIGSAYSAEDYERWSQFDPNYIGFGQDYVPDKPANVRVLNNPFDRDWDKTDSWSDLVKKARDTGKTFDAVYLDWSVDRSIDSTLSHEMRLHIPKFLLRPGGSFYMPDKSSNITTLPYNWSRMSKPEQESVSKEARLKVEAEYLRKFTPQDWTVTETVEFLVHEKPVKFLRLQKQGAAPVKAKGKSASTTTKAGAMDPIDITLVSYGLPFRPDADCGIVLVQRLWQLLRPGSGPLRYEAVTEFLENENRRKPADATRWIPDQQIQLVLLEEIIEEFLKEFSFRLFIVRELTAREQVGSGYPTYETDLNEINAWNNTGSPSAYRIALISTKEVDQATPLPVGGGGCRFALIESDIQDDEKLMYDLSYGHFAQKRQVLSTSQGESPPKKQQTEPFGSAETKITLVSYRSDNKAQADCAIITVQALGQLLSVPLTYEQIQNAVKTRYLMYGEEGSEFLSFDPDVQIGDDIFEDIIYDLLSDYQIEEYVITNIPFDKRKNGPGGQIQNRVEVKTLNSNGTKRSPHRLALRSNIENDPKTGKAVRGCGHYTILQTDLQNTKAIMDELVYGRFDQPRSIPLPQPSTTQVVVERGESTQKKQRRVSSEKQVPARTPEDYMREAFELVDEYTRRYRASDTLMFLGYDELGPITSLPIVSNLGDYILNVLTERTEKHPSIFDLSNLTLVFIGSARGALELYVALRIIQLFGEIPITVIFCDYQYGKYGAYREAALEQQMQTVMKDAAAQGRPTNAPVIFRFHDKMQTLWEVLSPNANAANTCFFAFNRATSPPSEQEFMRHPRFKEFARSRFIECTSVAPDRSQKPAGIYVYVQELRHIDSTSYGLIVPHLIPKDKGLAVATVPAASARPSEPPKSKVAPRGERSVKEWIRDMNAQLDDLEPTIMEMIRSK